jgi:DOMON domain
MMTRARNLILAAAALAAALAFAHPAAAETAAPVDDGVVKPGEYALDMTDGPVHLYYTITANRIYIAVVAEATGWVGLGLDSSRMNGAKIFIGYYDNGKPAFTDQLGQGHRHLPTDSFSALDHAVLRSGGATTMEVTLDRSAFLQSGDTSLDVIYAESGGDDITAHHDFRGSATLAVR